MSSGGRDWPRRGRRSERKRGDKFPTPRLVIKFKNLQTGESSAIPAPTQAVGLGPTDSDSRAGRSERSGGSSDDESTANTEHDGNPVPGVPAEEEEDPEFINPPPPPAPPLEEEAAAEEEEPEVAVYNFLGAENEEEAGGEDQVNNGVDTTLKLAVPRRWSY